MKLTLRGSRRVRKRLEARAQRIQDQAQQAIEKTAEAVQETAKENVPVDTGALRDDIQVEVGKMSAEVYNTLPYAYRIEKGFTGTDAAGRYYDQEGTHYLSRAAMKHQHRLAAELRDLI